MISSPAGFIGKSKGSSFEDNELYSLEQVLAVLQLAHQHIAFSEECIFILTGGAGFETLKNLLRRTKKQNPTESYATAFLHQLEILSKTNRLLTNTLQEKKAELQALEAGKSKESTLQKSNGRNDVKTDQKAKLVADIRELESKVAGPTAWDWAVLCKWVVLRGCILQETMEVHATLRVLCSQLRSFYPNVDVKDKERLRIVFKEFLGQLCQINHGQSAQAYHMFLNLGHCVLDPVHTALNKVDKSMLAKMLGKTLLEGLTLLGQFIPRKEHDLSFNASAEAAEARFFASVIEILFEDNIYAQPFTATTYQSFSQMRFPSELTLVKEELNCHLRQILWGSFAQLKEPELPASALLTPASAAGARDNPSTDLKLALAGLSLNETNSEPDVNRRRRAQTPTPSTVTTPRRGDKKDEIERPMTPRGKGSIVPREDESKTPRRRAHTHDKTYAPAYGLIAQMGSNPDDGKNADPKSLFKKHP